MLRCALGTLGPKCAEPSNGLTHATRQSLPEAFSPRESEQLASVIGLVFPAVGV